MRRNVEAMANVPSGDLIEVRAQIGARMASVVLSVDAYSINPADGRIQVTGTVRGADWSTSTDGRVDRQRAAIDRLLSHLKQHCPEFTSGQLCEHNNEEGAS